MPLLLIAAHSCNNNATEESLSAENKSLDKSDQVLTAPNKLIEPDTFRYCVSPGNLGIAGYDLVNYFTADAAELGSPKHESNYNGVIYRFKTAENKKLFESDPKKYLPTYGGWCSMTLAMGRATQPTYDNFKIIDDKLHLFERTLSINGQTLWVKNHAQNTKLAKKHYGEYVDNGKVSDVN